MSVTIDDFAAKWLQAKEQEATATKIRREIEDIISEMCGVQADTVGTNHYGISHDIEITGKLTKKVDSDLLQEIAAENGLTEFLPTLFRWKPEINAAAWKHADKRVTDILLGAVTTKPNRPSFSITVKE